MFGILSSFAAPYHEARRFNRREGDELYPRVVDTEHRLQSNREEFVLEEVVDEELSVISAEWEPASQGG